MGTVSRLSAVRRRLLATCVAGALGTATHLALANTLTVTNCNDAGAGSLRATVASAANNDTVDLSSLTPSATGCSASKITLRTGDIHVTQNNLTIQGPGRDNLTITGKYGTFPSSTTEPYRLLTHSGTGLLSISGLTLTKGYVKDAVAKGGCIYSAGSVFVDEVGIYACLAKTTGTQAAGGAIWTNGSTRIKYSTLSTNAANAGTSGTAAAGALVALNGLNMKYSTITSNSAMGPSGNNQGIAGAAYVAHKTYIRNSTIDNNYAASQVGGMIAIGNGADYFYAINTTISSNRSNIAGGLVLNTPKSMLANSTIAFNSATNGSASASAGVTLGVGTLELESTLIADNAEGGLAAANDLFAASGTTITGSSNLVRASAAVLPAGTLRHTCPLLGALRDNGGPTATHALLSRSPGIDQGSNPGGFHEDQRGKYNDTSPYPYPRSSGTAPDIGAYEVQQTDIIFDNNLEGCVGDEF